MPVVIDESTLMLMDTLQSGIQGTDLKDSQPKVEGTLKEKRGAKTWRRRTFVVKAVPEGDVNLRQKIQMMLVLAEDGYRCLPGLAPASSLPSPPGAQVGKCDAPSATCHRVVTTPAVGRRPIWEYRSDKELLTGLLYVLESHQRLCSRGWLHGDISANNIFLAIDEEHAKHAPGFMIDWDAGYAPPDVTDPGTKVAMQELPGCGGPVQEPVPSAAATGIVTGNLAFKSRQFPSMETLQFMSRRQLTQVLDPSSNIQPTPGDDVESFFLVLVYAVIHSLACSDRMLYVKSRDKDSQLDFEFIRWRRQQLLDFFEEHWGAKAVGHILTSREGGDFLRSLLHPYGPPACPSVGKWLLWGEQVLISNALVNNVLSKCVKKFTSLDLETREVDSLESHDWSVPVDMTPTWTESQLFTHDELFKMFNDAIAKMDSSPNEIAYTEEQEKVANEQNEAKRQEKMKKFKSSTVDEEQEEH